MSLTTAVAWTIAFAVLLFALLRRELVSVLVPVSSGTAAPALPEDDDEQQQPETDRVQRRIPWLTATVVATAAVRIGLLVALHR
jgi:hypothetical protein